jgi:hypothetical protein
MLGTICTELLDALNREINRPLRILETGTAFQMRLEPGEADHSERSTVAIARWISAQKPSDHIFNSVDLDADHISISRTMLSKYGLDTFVKHHRGTLGGVIGELPTKLDFALLDSDSGPQTPFAEYELVRERMAFNGIVVVDDAFKHASVNKATLIMQELARTGRQPYFALRHQAIGISFGPLAQVVLENYSKR